MLGIGKLRGTFAEKQIPGYSIGVVLEREWRNGRRPGFRFRCRKAWGFKSPLAHQIRSSRKTDGYNRRRKESESMYFNDAVRWAEEAEALRPELVHRRVFPVRLVRPVPDPAAWQGWRAVPAGELREVLHVGQPRSWSCTFDMGEYCVGYIELTFRFRGRIDAPFRFRVKCAESPYELAADFDACRVSLGERDSHLVSGDCCCLEDLMRSDTSSWRWNPTLPDMWLSRRASAAMRSVRLLTSGRCPR